MNPSVIYKSGAKIIGKLMERFSGIGLYIAFCLLCTISPLLKGEEGDRPAYLKELEELGYCVIPDVFPEEEAKNLYERVWREFIEKAWPLCRMDDRTNWKEVFPKHDEWGIFVGPAGQIQVMWDVRQDKRIVDLFAKIWNTHDLIVSMDGISLMCPPEIREIHFDPWPHVDQDILEYESQSCLETNPFTVQGQFLFEESLEGDGGFYCIPKSHVRFHEFTPILEEIDKLEIPPKERFKISQQMLQDFFSKHRDEEGSPYEAKHIQAPRGSIILWDSRTVHWNQPPDQARPYHENPKVRMVGYVCYVPKSRLTPEAKILRKKVFEEGVTTGHDPAAPIFRYTKNRITKELEKYLEDPSYTQPTIDLTPLGQLLLGI